MAHLPFQGPDHVHRARLVAGFVSTYRSCDVAAAVAVVSGWPGHGAAVRPLVRRHRRGTAGGGYPVAADPVAARARGHAAGGGLCADGAGRAPYSLAVRAGRDPLRHLRAALAVAGLPGLARHSVRRRGHCAAPPVLQLPATVGLWRHLFHRTRPGHGAAARCLCGGAGRGVGLARVEDGARRHRRRGTGAPERPHRARERRVRPALRRHANG